MKRLLYLVAKRDFNFIDLSTVAWGSIAVVGAHYLTAAILVIVGCCVSVLAENRARDLPD